MSVLQNIDTSKAIGPDGIPDVFLKNCAKELAPSFTKLLNISLQAGVFPNSWKIANICPILKKSDRTNCENYRPISLLNILSNFFERAICNIVYPEIKDLIHNWDSVERRWTKPYWLLEIKSLYGFVSIICSLRQNLKNFRLWWPNWRYISWFYKSLWFSSTSSLNTYTSDFLF